MNDLESRRYVFDIDENYKSVTKEELLEMDKSKEWDGITVGYNNKYIFLDDCYVTDKDHPFANINSFFDKNIYVDGIAFGNDKNQMYSFIREIFNKFNIDSITVGSDYYNLEFLAFLCSVPKIKEIKIGRFLEEHTLTLEEYKMVKNCGHIERIITTNVVPELKDVEDEIIVANFKNVKIGNYSFENLKKCDDIFLSEGDLTEDNYKYLKYLNPNAKICFSKMEKTVDIVNNLKYLQVFGVKNQIFIEVNLAEKNILSEFFRNNPEFLKMNITLGMGYKNEINVVKFVEYEERLYKLIEPALTLSPLERYLYAYNVVKKFKPYRENQDDKSSSRDIYQILDNEYMVCVGYSKLLGDLLDKLGIENSDYSVRVDNSYDNVSVNQVENFGEELTKGVGHARREVRIVDPKYDVDGIYLTDPTWDNDMKNDCYCHALMTHDQYNQNKRYTFVNRYDASEAFFAHDLEEFYQKVNFLLDSYIGRWLNTEKGNSEYNPKDYEKVFGAAIESFLGRILDAIKDLDKGKYQEILLRFPYVKRGKMSKEQLQNVLEYIGEYVVSNVNNKIKGETLKDAITVLYRDCYHTDEEILDDKVNEVMDYNKKMYELCFPKRYRIMDDGSKIPIDEYENVFEISEKGMSK